jgi:hypothetical protein
MFVAETYRWSLRLGSRLGQLATADACLDVDWVDCVAVVVDEAVRAFSSGE